MENYDPQEAFRKYLKEKEGQPVDPRAVSAGERELIHGKKGGFAVYGDEPDRNRVIASYPKGAPPEKQELQETENHINKEKIEAQIKDLTEARQIITAFMEGLFGDFDSSTLTLSDLTNNMIESSEDVKMAVNTLFENGFKASDELWSLPNGIIKKIEENKKLLQSL
jgi:hypothetical protein